MVRRCWFLALGAIALSAVTPVSPAFGASPSPERAPPSADDVLAIPSVGGADPLAIPAAEPGDPLAIGSTEGIPDVDIPMAVVGSNAPEIGFWDASDLWALPITAAVIAGILLAWVGVYVVLSRGSFVSAAVSNLAGLGVVVAIMAIGFARAAGLPEAPAEFAPLVGLVFGVIGTGLFGLTGRSRGLPSDALLAIVVIGASALTLVVAGFLTTEYQHIKDALYGDAVVATGREVAFIGGVATLVLAVHFLFRHRFLYILQDPESAGAQGMPVRRWSLVLGGTVGLSIAIATTGIGALPAFGFTVLPASIALLAARRIRAVFVVAVLSAVIAALLGYYVSFAVSLPTGPCMVAVLLVMLAPAKLVSLRG